MALFQRWKTRKTPTDFSDVWEAWDYPAPIVEGHFKRFEGDWRLRDIVEQAYHGWFYCQKAVVDMSLIHPFTDYRPTIDAEFREYFDARFEEHEAMPLIVYERKGQLIMSNDYKAYCLYKEHGVSIADCVIIGPFTKVVGLEAYDKPFLLEKPEVTLPAWLKSVQV